MKILPVLAATALLGVCACDQIENDPDVKEARAAVENAIEDDGEGIKQVYNEARATRDSDRDTNEAEEDSR